MGHRSKRCRSPEANVRPGSRGAHERIWERVARTAADRLTLAYGTAMSQTDEAGGSPVSPNRPHKSTSAYICVPSIVSHGGAKSHPPRLKATRAKRSLASGP